MINNNNYNNNATSLAQPWTIPRRPREIFEYPALNDVDCTERVESTFVPRRSFGDRLGDTSRLNNLNGVSREAIWQWFERYRSSRGKGVSGSAGGLSVLRGTSLSIAGMRAIFADASSIVKRIGDCTLLMSCVVQLTPIVLETTASVLSKFLKTAAVPIVGLSDEHGTLKCVVGIFPLSRRFLLRAMSVRCLSRVALISATQFSYS